MAVRPRPKRAGSLISSRNWRIRYSPGSTFQAWQVESPPPRFRGSYGFNNSIAFFTRAKDVESYSVKGLANIPVILDSTTPRIEHNHDDAPPQPGTPSFIYGAKAFCINRHNEHVNGLFMNWSVRRIGLKELWTLKWHDDYNTAGPWTKAGGVQPSNWPEWMRNFRDY